MLLPFALAISTVPPATGVSVPTPAPIPIAAERSMDRARTVLDALLRAGRADPAAFAPSFLKEISAARVDAILTQVTAALGSFDRIDGTHGTYLAHYPRGTDLITVTMDERDRITGLIFAPPVIAGRPVAALSPGVSVVIDTCFGGRRVFRVLGERVDADAPFEIGSITKTFTATLLAQMVQAGDLEADDPISKFLPHDARTPTYDGRPITLEQLATQSSGLPRLPTDLPVLPTDPYATYDDAKLMAFLAMYTLPRAPGATYEYSNLGYGLLGDLLARKLNVSYSSALRSRVLEPLELRSTTLETAARRSVIVGHAADGTIAPNWTFDALAGAGALVSTPNDLMRFALANLYLSETPLGAAMNLAQEPRRAAMGSDRIGFAWMTAPSGIVWHNGGTGGYRSFVGIWPGRGRAVVILANSIAVDVEAIGFTTLASDDPEP